MSEDPHALKLYIDGNAYNNPGGNGGFACYAEFPEPWGRPNELLFNCGFVATTNNRMELSACIQAIEHLIAHAERYRGLRVMVITDSQYVFDNLNICAAWRRNGWHTKAGRPVENSDLWKRFLSVRSRCRCNLQIVWRKGKKTSILKDVDKAAKAAGKAPNRHDRGFRQGKIGRSMLTRGAAALFPADAQEATIRIYRSSLIRKTGHKFHFTVSDRESPHAGQKFIAYGDNGIATLLHRGHEYRVLFNSTPAHPQILEVIA